MILAPTVLFRGPTMRHMPSCLALCTAASITGVLVALLLPAGDRDLTHHYLPAMARARSDFGEIAGEFFKEHKYGAQCLSILADGRYSFFSYACTGVGARESGQVRRAGACYVLTSETPCKGRLERVYQLIRWQGRCYLIPPERMQDFCDEIIEGAEPRDAGSGSFYLRSPRAQVSGVPELPQQWADYLRQHLVMGKIVGIMDGDRAKVDVGKASGIQRETVLVIRGRDQYGPQRLFVVSVEDEYCIAGQPDYKSSESPLELGLSVVARR
jgi:hypothetical protein